VGGVPLLWPIVIKPPKFLRKSLISGIWRANGAFSIPLLGRAGSRREWLVLIPVSGYAMVGMGAAGWALAQQHWPGVLAALGGVIQAP